jgi:hypothetical protein
LTYARQKTPQVLMAFKRSVVLRLLPPALVCEKNVGVVESGLTHALVGQ